MNRKAIIISLVCFLFAFISFSISHAQDDQEVVIRGVGPIIDGDVANAKKVAIADAQRRAVEQVVGVLVEGNTKIINDLMQDDRLMSQAAGFIKSYKILNEREARGLFEVTIHALVSTRSIKTSLEAIGIIKARMSYPRIVVLYHPSESDIPSTAVSAEIALVKSLVEKHFDVVDPSKSKQLHKEAQELFKIDTVENVAAKIGLKHYAEIVIMYRISEQYTGNDGTFETAKSTLQTRVIVSTTAQILTTDERTETGMAKTKVDAMRKASSKIGQVVSEYIIDQVLSWWDDYTNNGIPYIITLRTPEKTDMPGIIFEETLENLAGVTGMSERFMGGGLLEVMVKYRGGTSQLRRAILKSLMREQGFEKLHTEVSKGRFIVFSIL